MMGRGPSRVIWQHSNPVAPWRQMGFLLLLLSLVSLGFGPPVITDGHYPSLRLYPDQIEALQRAKQAPQVTAFAAMVVDLDANQVLYSLNAQEPTPPASTAKIVTALVVMQQSLMSDPVTVSANAAGTTGSRMGLLAGETLTVENLLYGLLLPSGNDAAVALAEHVAGSHEAFVAMMNKEAASLGLSQTHFVNAHGLDQEGQFTSAADLVTAARAALKYPVFAQIVATADANVQGHDLVNTNELLKSYDGADGIKTGTTDAAGECLVASVNRHGHRLIVVVLGSKDRYADARALLSYAAEGWTWYPAALPDDALAWETGSDGRAYRLQADGSADFFIPSWQAPLIKPVRVLAAGVPLTATIPIGTLRFQLGDQVLANLPLKVIPNP